MDGELAEPQYVGIQGPLVRDNACGGHALIPYTYTVQGPATLVYVYDPNRPLSTEQTITMTQDSWEYDHNSDYLGTWGSGETCQDDEMTLPTSLVVIPLSAWSESPEPPWDVEGGVEMQRTESVLDYYEFVIDDGATLRIENTDGEAVGNRNGELVEEIPGSYVWVPEAVIPDVVHDYPLQYVISSTQALTASVSIREHLAAVRKLAQLGIPVEMNDPNQWSSRWAHDTLICGDYGLITAVMLNASVRDLVLQMQFNKPRETGDLADLAKMTASLELANELLPLCPDRPRIWKETRTGVGYFDPDPDTARFQLARSTFLQMMISPHIIHVVSYCEADHAATVKDIVESSKLVRRCVRIFKQHKPELTKYLRDPIVVERREFLLKEARFLLQRIAHLGRSSDGLDGGALERLVPQLADARTLIKALRRGYVAAPGVFHPAYPAGQRLTTGPTQNGFIDCLDPQTGLGMPEEARLSFVESE